MCPNLASFLVSQPSATYPYLGSICHSYNFAFELFTMLPTECREAANPPRAKTFQNNLQFFYLVILFQESLKGGDGSIVGCFVGCSFRGLVCSDLSRGHGNDDLALVVSYCDVSILGFGNEMKMKISRPPQDTAG